MIRDSKAMLLTSANDIVESLGWQTARWQQEERKRGIQLEAFPELSPDSQRVLDVLADGDALLNVISVKSGLPVGKAAAVLFELEMQGFVKPYAGGMYHRCR